MKTVLIWILLIFLAAAGIGGSYALSEAFRADAQKTWKAEASQIARWLSATVLGWLEESYAPLSGLAILFENSREVTEVEFLGATDALEARATTFFLDAKAVARPQANGKEWHIEFSNDPLGPLSPDLSINRYPAIVESIKVAVAHPERVMLGSPFSPEDGERYSPAALAVHDGHGPLVVIGLINYGAIVKGLFDLHKLDGLQLQIEGRFQEVGGPGPQREVIGKPLPTALHTVTTRTVSAGADLSVIWYMDKSFRGGPQENLANLTFIGGIAGTILLVSFIGLLLQRNRTISKKVEEATDELAESRQRLDLTLAASGIGTWDWNIVDDTMFWDEALNRILGTDPALDKRDLASFTRLVHPEDKHRFESEIEKALAGEKNLSSEYRFLRQDGELRTLGFRGHAIRDAGSRPIRMIGLSMDITERKLAEEELEKLSRAVEQSPASVVITDLKGTIKYVNPKFCEVTGYSVEEAIGQNPRILKSGETAPKVYRQLWNTIVSGKEWRGELLNRKKNGDLYWEAISISSIRSAEGSISHYLAVKEDITARKQMEESIREKEARFRGYFEHSQVGMAVTSPTKKWVEANDQLQRMLGYTLDELRRLTWAELTHPDDIDMDSTQFERMLAGEIDSYTLEKRFIRKDGEIVSTDLTVSCIRDETGDIRNVLASFQDITERKKMENDLHERVKDLDEAQSAMLNMMEDLDGERARAEEATRAKSDFLANMSHEIRTPMNAVIGMAHLALKTELTPKQQDYLNKIQSSANSLLGIINDILDFSKIEAGKLDMETVEFDLSETLDNVANVITVKAQEKENLEVLFNLDSKVPNFLVGDPLRLNQILVNLGNNAVKFTDKGEIVLTTSIRKISEDKVTLQFSIRDTGIGMTAEQRTNLFQEFTQADTSTTRKYGGTGLGLTISKRLVEMMGGEIWVESEPGRGTTFSFTAEFGLGKETVKKRFVPAPDVRGMNVLVVDDNETSRNILQDILESFSLEVTVADSAKDGLAELERADGNQAFELVIMDWKMPGMDGIEASRRIKGHPALRKIPAIILVTAYGREELMQEVDDIGLEGYLLKPVSSSVLFDTIMQALGKEIRDESRAVRKQERNRVDPNAIHGARVLLVEDNEINQQVALEILQGAGLNVSVANNGQEAVDAVKTHNFDAILMDIQMPVMDGHTATRQIRRWESGIGNSEFGIGNGERELKAQSSRLKENGLEELSAFSLQPSADAKRVPIIAMTAHAMAGDEQKSIEAGMNDHVTKPIDPDQLFAALVKWIAPVEGKARAPAAAEVDAPPETIPADSDEVQLPESLPGFDLGAGLKRLGGNERLYRKLLLDFGANYTNVAGEIREALETKDLKKAHSLIHNLKGMAGNLEATDLQIAAVEIEKLVKKPSGKTSTDESMMRQFSKLEEALKLSLAAVHTLGIPVEEKTAKSKEEDSVILPPELAKQTAGRIRSAAEVGDVMQIKSIAEELKTRSADFSPLCEKIIQLADDFDFDGCLQLAAGLEG